MGQIWITSDWHFCHDREFIYKPRGFSNAYEMTGEIIKRYNEVVQPDDDVYVLGDLMLNNNYAGIQAIKRLKGRIHIIRGNHDTDNRITLYNECWNVVEVSAAAYLKYKGINFYLSHFPTITSNLEKGPELKSHLINLYGHTHQQTNFYNEIPYMYHVGVDSHNCYPVSIDAIIEDIKKEVQKCIKNL